MLALLLPSLSFAREKVRRLICANNLRQWGVAWQMYADENDGYLAEEGTFLNNGIKKDAHWFNALPPYLGLPPYKSFSGANVEIEELPNIHVWICPSKNLTASYKSYSGKNQIHYGANYVLDGVGPQPNGSRDTPGFPDHERAMPVSVSIFKKRPYTVLMFDIADNSPGGTPRHVATQYYRNFFNGAVSGEFHGDYANILYINGGVGHCTIDDLVTDRDNRYGDIIWDRPHLYWGYPPPGRR